MVVFQINVVGVAILKSERQPPVGFYCHRPDIFAVPLERMQPKGWLVHILSVARLVQCREDYSQAVSVIGFDLARSISKTGDPAPK